MLVIQCKPSIKIKINAYYNTLRNDELVHPPNNFLNFLVIYFYHF